MRIGVRHALSEVRENFTSPKWWRNRVLIPYVFGTATRLDPRNPGYREAVRVMEEDWDNLIILDACRADIFEEVADLESFDEYRREISLGSHSSEWTRRNFSGREFGDTVYVSANPHTGMVAGDSFHELVELRESEFDDKYGTVLPETMVERAIEVHERNPNKRLIVHFMQPHSPFIYEGASPPPFTGTVEDFWEGYAKSLDHVLPMVNRLASIIKGLTVISADHGQTFGREVYGVGLPTHPPQFRLPELVTVPWATIEYGRRDIIAGTINEIEPSEDVELRLSQLGYHS